ncbi:hypothetical protein LTR84_010151 [Exophiala bonariae]|uniref:ASX DEUBAD domain-containing protein n=1 Tax=Exophiala bonariae TaxID=1690606 RepID=A0AAV9MWS5_9EURO|nr:hypothetical protein LTR84_010151 [Exophiala bonariae]
MPPARKNAPTRNSGPWSCSRILNSSSPLASKEILPFLVTCISGWNSDYDETQKKVIIDSLPEKYRKYHSDNSGHLLCPISPEFLLEDPYFRSAVAKFKTNLADGFYEKTWQNQAAKASQEREQGKFANYLREKAEADFGLGDCIKET